MPWFLPDANRSWFSASDRLSMANRFTRTVPPMRLLVLSVAARLPVTMLSLGLLVHAQRMTGSFAVAGLVSGAYAAGLAFGGPLLGRRIDACGQTRVLAVCGALCGAAVVAAAFASGAAALIGLAAFAGVVTPPVGACVRSLLDPAQYGIEATASEFTWIAGPPAVLALGSLTSTGTALAVAGIGLAALTAAFAAVPASRAWRPGPAPVEGRGGALRAPAMRVLVLVMALVGVLFGAAEVGVTAAAHALGSTAAAGPLMGIWGAGSVAGGIVLVRSRKAPRLAPLLLALAVSHAALALGSGVISLAALLALAGATIAPTYATAFGRVDRAAPQGTATEAFAWLNTAVASGSAAGAALAGALADTAGASAVFVLAGVAGLAAAGIAAACARQSTGLTSSTGVPSSASM